MAIAMAGAESSARRIPRSSWLSERTQVTLVPSQGTRQRLLRDGVERVEIWSRGVDARVFHPSYRDDGLRRRLGLGPDGVLLVYVGRLAPEKNLAALLAATRN